MTIVVYGDFVSLPCYLASRRVDALAAAGVAVDWRAVEQHPGAPVTGCALGETDRAALEAQAEELQQDLLAGEKLLWAVPSLLPRTDAAVSAYAEACGAGIDDEVRGLLFAAYWIGGADIGNPEVLRNLLIGPVLRASANSPVQALREAGYCVSVNNRGPISTDAWRQVRAWQEQRRQNADGPLPVLTDGVDTLSGTDALRRLGVELTRVGGDQRDAASGLDPGRYPATPAAPTGWISEVGGPWKYAIRVPLAATRASSTTRQLVGDPS
jgi:hypothetical protein